MKKDETNRRAWHLARHEPQLGKKFTAHDSTNLVRHEETVLDSLKHLLVCGINIRFPMAYIAPECFTISVTDRKW